MKGTVRMTGMSAVKVTEAVERVGEEETVEKKKRSETAGAATEEEKAYIHWLYQAAGFGKVSERYAKKVAQMSEFTRGYDVPGVYGRMRERGIFLVTENEPQFPERLSRIPDKPYVLYCAGKLPQEGKKAVALIGARDCTSYGRYMAEQFGAAFARAGVQVISGMARGIDGVGQSAALQEGGYSLGVLGCGVDFCYPRENRAV